VSVEARDAAAHFDPARLKLARQLQAITRAEVARRAEISAAAVSQLEAGAHGPRPATLARLALALAVPVGFFASTGQATLLPAVSDSFFRSLRRTTQRDRERAAAHAGLAAELARVIERSVLLPGVASADDLALDLSDPPGASEEAAIEIRKRWNLPDEPVDNVVRVLERHGILVVRSQLASANVDAFSWAEGARPIVVLGRDKNVYERSRLDAAHELAHVLLHRADPEPASPPLERQAQRFAGALLVPREHLREEWPPGRIDWGHIQRLRMRWGVSMAALLYRAKDLELLSHPACVNAMKYMSRRGWRTREPGPQRPVEEPILLAEALALLEDNGIDFDELVATGHLIAADDLRHRLGLSTQRSLRVEI